MGREPTAKERADCGERGGEMRSVGMLGSYRCIIAYADAGKPCTDGGQCEGDCLAENNYPPPPPGQPAVAEAAPVRTASAGVCQADNNPFGCRAIIEDGKATPATCVD